MSTAHHRFDSFTRGQVTRCRILMGGLIKDVTKAEFVKHPRDKPQMIQDLHTVRGRWWWDSNAPSVGKPRRRAKRPQSGRRRLGS